MASPNEKILVHGGLLVGRNIRLAELAEGCWVHEFTSVFIWSLIRLASSLWVGD